MKKKYLILLLLFCQTIAFSQDKKIMKIVKYIEKSKDEEAKEILDELDTKPEYQSDIYYWFVRTIYYRNAARENNNSTTDLAESRKSFEKLVELDKKDSSKTFTDEIPKIRKELYEGKNQLPQKEIKISSNDENKPDEVGKTLTLTQVGEGRTKEDAKYNALRNALEKAFGVYISSNTTLLNDEIIKDEIISLSSGNIQNFEILSEIQMPDGGFSSLVKATVSIDRLKTFCESKGITVEFKGGVYAANIKMKQIQEANTYALVSSVCNEITKLVQNRSFFDYKIEVREPKGLDGLTLDVTVTATANNNFNIVEDLILKTKSGIQDISILDNSSLYLDIFKYTLPLLSLNFKISDGIKEYEAISLFGKEHRHCDMEPSRDFIKAPESALYYYNNAGEMFSGGHLTVELLEKLYNQNDIERVRKKYFPGFSELTTDPFTHYFNEIKIDISKIAQTSFVFNFYIHYTLDELAKITEFKVQPIK